MEEVVTNGGNTMSAYRRSTVFQMGKSRERCRTETSFWQIAEKWSRARAYEQNAIRSFAVKMKFQIIFIFGRYSRWRKTDGDILSHRKCMWNMFAFKFDRKMNSMCEQKKKTRKNPIVGYSRRTKGKSKYLRNSVTDAVVTKSNSLEKSMIEILPFYAILFFFFCFGLFCSVSLLLFECFERFCSLACLHIALSLSLTLLSGVSVRIEFII